MAGGWVKIHRSIESCAALDTDDAEGVWVRLVRMAAHDARAVTWKGQTIVLQPGQLCLSVRAWSRERGTSYKRLRNILARFEREGMIEQQPILGAVSGTLSGAVGIRVSICNYSRYQLSEEEKGAGQGAPGAHQGRTRGAQNKKEEKERKNLTDSESLPSIVTSDKPKRRQAYPAEFEAFWRAYPQRPTDTKRSAFAAWQKALKGGTGPPDLQAAAERYAAFVRRTDHASMLVQTWINREGWTASYEGKGNGHGKASIVERVASRLRAEGSDLFGPDGPVVEGGQEVRRRRGH